MRICPKCHSVYDDNEKFCTYCGEKLPAQGSSDESAEANAPKAPAPEQPAQEQPVRHWEEYRKEDFRREEKTSGAAPGTAPGTAPGGDRVVYTDIVPRSIPMAIILSFVTCGFYSLYWFYKLNNEVNELAEDTQAPDGLLALVFTIITCGIYGLYWLYQMGKKCDYISGKESSSSILFLVLGIFGLSIVSYALIQDTINRALN